MLVWKRSDGSAMPGRCAWAGGMGMLLGSRTATPAAFRGRCVSGMPSHGLRLPSVGGRFGGCGCGWWFENWIVDASKATACSVVVLVSEVSNRTLKSFFESFRSFCDHDYRVMICRLVVREFGLAGAPPICRGVGVACKGVWWMPWQTGPMKDVAGRDRPRGAAERALIRGCPNGGTRPS